MGEREDFESSRGEAIPCSFLVYAYAVRQWYTETCLHICERCYTRRAIKQFTLVNCAMENAWAPRLSEDPTCRMYTGGLEPGEAENIGSEYLSMEDIRDSLVVPTHIIAKRNRRTMRSLFLTMARETLRFRDPGREGETRHKPHPSPFSYAQVTTRSYGISV